MAALLSVTGSAIRYDSNSIETNPDVLSERFNMLNPLSDILNEINRCIISETEIAEDVYKRQSPDSSAELPSQDFQALS